MSNQEILHDLHSTRFQQRKLIVRRIGDELLLFDEETSMAHCLNGIAGEIWMACERESSAFEVAEILRPRWPDLDKEVIRAALIRMASAGLLDETKDQEVISMSRRELVRKLGFTAAVVLPIVVTSVLIPPAAAAASCGHLGSLCGPGKPPCCAGLNCTVSLVCAP